MGVVFLEHLGGVCSFLCKKCGTFLSNCGNCYDRRFVGVSGTAFLFYKVVNVTHGEVRDKYTPTGKYKIRDAYCKKCTQKVGWFCEFAYEENERWKQGKTMLEKNKMSKKRGIHNQPQPLPPHRPPYYNSGGVEYLD